MCRRLSYPLDATPWPDGPAVLTVRQTANPTVGEPSANPTSDGIGVRIVLGVLMAFGALSTDLYLPALPVIGTALNASHGAMELTISSYLVGFSLTQLVWGPISDRWGRRGPVLAGLGLFVLGSAGCAVSVSVEIIIACRIVQALGACAGVVLARAMVRDIYGRNTAAGILSTLMMIMAVAPLVGPLLGAAILEIGSWRLIFWFLVLIGLTMLVAVWTFPETLTRERRTRENLGSALREYVRLLRHRGVMGYALVGCFYYAGSFAFIAGSPFAYIDIYGVSPLAYAALFGAAIVGIMGSNYINSRMVTRTGPARVLVFGAASAAVCGVCVCICASTGIGGLPALAISLTAFISTSGLIVANSLAGALAQSESRIGAVSALTGAMHYGAGIIGSGLVGLGANGTLWPLGLVVAGSGLLSFGASRLLR